MVSPKLSRSAQVHAIKYGLICTVITLVWRKTAPCLLQVWKLLPLYIRVEYKLCDSFNWESMVVVRFFYHVIRCIQLRLFLNFLRQCNLKILLRPWVVEVCGVCLKLSDWVERKIKRSVERWTVEKKKKKKKLVGRII